MATVAILLYSFQNEKRRRLLVPSFFSHSSFIARYLIALNIFSLFMIIVFYLNILVFFLFFLHTCFIFRNPFLVFLR